MNAGYKNAAELAKLIHSLASELLGDRDEFRNPDRNSGKMAWHWSVYCI